MSRLPTLAVSSVWARFAATPSSLRVSVVRFIAAPLVVYGLGSQVVVLHIGQSGSAPLTQIP
jgi:hypothetical protein